MSYTCDCGYVIQNAADEEKHLKEIHQPDWIPTARKKVATKAEPKVAEVKQSTTTTTTKSNPTNPTTKKK